MTHKNSAIHIHNLNKTYAPQKKGDKPFQALKNVSLDIPKGSIFGLLGPNGAGKSTLINIIAGLVIKTDGGVHINGFNMDTQERLAKLSVGIVSQEINFDAFFNPYDMLELQAGLYGIPKSERITDELLEFVGLSDKARSYVRALSGGMKRRLMIGKAMVHQPPILILDEPTAGVDIELRRQLWDNVRKLNEQGVTIILTTHYLEEAEELCDYIAIINKGEILTSQSKEDILGQMNNKLLTVRLQDQFDEIPDQLKALGAERKGKRSLAFRYSPKERKVSDYLSAIQDAKMEITDITTSKSNLEDVFLEMTTAA